METKVNHSFQDILWRNFAASIDMLNQIILACPDETWRNEKKIFYMSYHTLIFLDFYLTSPVKDFQAKLPYTICDPENIPIEAIDDVIPDHFYTKEDMISYIYEIRVKCFKLIKKSPIEKFSERWITEDEIKLHELCPESVIDYNLLEILFYNFRHIQHHVAQLNLLLRQKTNIAVEWISQAD